MELIALIPERLNSIQFDRFRDFIYTSSGIRVAAGKVTMLSNRIRARVTAGGFDNFDSYYDFLTSARGEQELSQFLSAVTTNETYFFRTSQQFDWLKSDWLTEQIALHRSGKRDAKLRILSAGCSNGAEPYSIAICLAENRFRLRGWDLSVLGTDISDATLEEARRGSYKSKAVQDIDDQQRKRYFQYHGDDDLWTIRDSVKGLVEFQNHNLMLPMTGKPFDCIFVRNVLIYFDQQSKRTVVDHLVDALADGGYLLVGPSEGVYGMLHDLKRVSTLVYQKVNGNPSRRQ